MGKAPFCPVTIYTTTEDLCAQANMLSNMQALSDIAGLVCCLDEEINAFSNRKIKPGDSLTLVAVGGTAWSWVGPNSFSSNAQNPTIENATSAAQGLYTVTITDGDCTQTRQAYVFVDQVVCLVDVPLPDASTIDEGVIWIDNTGMQARILCGGAWEPFPFTGLDTRAEIGGVVAYVPAASGNASNLGEFVVGSDGNVYYIDLNGDSQLFADTNTDTRAEVVAAPVAYVPAATGNLANLGQFVTGSDSQLYYIDQAGNAQLFIDTNTDTRALVTATPVAYVPAASGNVSNLGQFVTGSDGQVYYIDLLGNSQLFADTNTDTRAVVIATPVGYVPAASGNLSNLGEFVTGSDGMTYYIDLDGNSQMFASTNIYNSDGTISGVRTVSGGGTGSLALTSFSAIQLASSVLTLFSGGNYVFSSLPTNNSPDFLMGLDATDQVGKVDPATVLGPEVGERPYRISAKPNVCLGDTIELFADGPVGASYSWTGPNSYSSAVQSPTIASATAPMAGNYVVEISSGLITETIQVYVDVVNCPPPTAYVIIS